MGKDYVKQHVVSQGYLRHFGKKRNEKGTYDICVYNKKSNKVLVNGTHNVGFKKNYYDVTTREDPKYWEKFFSQNIEQGYIGALDRVISKTMLVQTGKPVLDEKDREDIGKLVAFQAMRVPAFLDSLIIRGMGIGEEYWNWIQQNMKAQIPTQQMGKIEKILLERDSIKDIELDGLSDDKRLKKYAKVLCVRKWRILYNDSDIPFFTSDNPVLLYSVRHQTTGSRDNGFGRAETLVYYPICSRIMLCFFPTWLNDGKDSSDERLYMNNNDIRFVTEINLKQVENSDQEVYCHPDYFDVFSTFFAGKK